MIRQGRCCSDARPGKLTGKKVMKMKLSKQVSKLIFESSGHAHPPPSVLVRQLIGKKFQDLFSRGENPGVSHTFPHDALPSKNDHFKD
jgi:hypothetical protein